MDRYFDLHPRACWTRGGKKSALYPKWLVKNTVPIFMQDHYDEVPASVKYPKGRIMMEFDQSYFTNQTAWMIALALTEGVTTLGLFGINYSTESEYGLQRGSAEFWLGVATGRGVRIVLPEQCTLLRTPASLYGYESHDERGCLRQEYKRRMWMPQETITPLAPGETYKKAEPPEHIREQIRMEEEDYPRPEWALGPLPDKPNGNTRQEEKSA
jgi:hypothetical protein